MRFLVAWLHRHLVFAIAAWALLVGASLIALFEYKGRPGSDGHPSVAWPEAAGLERATDRPTLLMFIHPECPCTRASIEELALIVDRSDVRARALVVVMTSEAAAAPVSTATVDRARMLPGVEVVFDPGGVEAARFGAETSGHVLVFSPNGERLYTGGVTGSRGHQGDNFGRAQVLALLTTGAKGAAAAHVYGCALGNDT
jgi:hypothetical protein